VIQEEPFSTFSDWHPIINVIVENNIIMIIINLFIQYPPSILTLIKYYHKAKQVTILSPNCNNIVTRYNINSI